MGKKIRKTRWRALTIADEQSDSEGSNTSTSVPRIPKNYHQHKAYYTSFTYSSQSTPRRRFQHDSSTKSTRSSSTASENKITFNEDEYTRITTPRQDVLFKKGYLNKPKNYQTQNSTGTSTSTGNSTGNGTPDHQSTDLEYESQFVFPNAFVDQNGIYYVNSYDSYPLFLYNPSTYFPEYSNVKSKRCSTGSLTESVSPNNEEATSQDLSQSGGEASNNVSDYNNGPVYNMIYPGYYVNGVCSQEVVNGQCSPEPKKIKKRRRRKVSKSQTNTQGDTSEFTDENESSDEVFNNKEKTTTKPVVEEHDALPSPPIEQIQENCVKEETREKSSNNTKDRRAEEVVQVLNGNELEEHEECNHTVKTQLKPDAEEFVPRAYRQDNNVLNSGGVQFVKIPPNFVPVSIINPIGEYNGQNFNHAFIPPGIPLNFIPQDPKLFQNFYGFVPNNQFVEKTDEEAENTDRIDENVPNSTVDEQTRNVNTAHKIEESKEDVPAPTVRQNQVDIAKIVSKLEEAAKEQEMNNDKSLDSSPMHKTKSYQSKQFRSSPRFRNKSTSFRKYTKPVSNLDNNKVNNNDTDSSESTTPSKVDRERKELPKMITNDNNQRMERNSPEKHRKYWKQNPYQSSPKRQISNNTPMKELKTKLNVKNYSDMVKKAHNCKMIAQTSQLNGGECSLPPKTSNTTSTNEKTPNNIENEQNKPIAKLSNQWISVSSRKKRKNYKNVEDLDELPEHNFVNEEELFESYDVNLLEDVIPRSQQLEQSQQDDIIIVEETEGVSQIKMANNLNEIITNVELLTQPNETSNNILIPEVSEIEKELIHQPTPGEIGLSEISVVEQKNQKQKKKTKKSAHKTVTKRVIITDVINTTDNSESTPINNTESKSTPKVNENVGISKEIANASKKFLTKPEKHLQSENVHGNNIQDTVKCTESSEKKSKKKKKKAIKVQLNNSLSSSETTLNATDDSYDFLLENVVFDDPLDKTNVEVSQELDKMIQKGLYSSLEEKMKSLNISKNDGFFQNVLNNISANSRESSVEKQANYNIKTPDLSKLLNPLHLFKPSSVSLEENNSKINMEISKIKLPDLELSSSSKAGFFLENPEVNELLQETNNNKNNNNNNKAGKNSSNCNEIVTKNDETDSSETLLRNESAIPIKSTAEYVETKTLYPITQAVKEWMNKTRQVTPDVELLKSPNAIYREFCASDDESDDETIVSEVFVEKNGQAGNSLKNVQSLNDEERGVAAAADDEVTLFSIEDISEDNEQQDLMDYWENDLENVQEQHCTTANECSKCNSDANIEKGEDILEVYESKYGQNEDYLKLQTEISSRQTKQYTRQGSLPYSRAICCNLM